VGRGRMSGEEHGEPRDAALFEDHIRIEEQDEL
jgi:hypothetical protein